MLERSKSILTLSVKKQLLEDLSNRCHLSDGVIEYPSKVLNIWQPLDSKIALKKFISGMFSKVHQDLYVIIFTVLNYRK